MAIIQASIPLFFVLIAAELLWAQRQGLRLSRLNDSLSDVSCGVLSQMAGIFDKAITLGVYVWVSSHAAVQRWVPMVPEWPARPLFPSAPTALGFSVDVPALISWCVVFVLVDFCYYWSHRKSHEVNLLWAGHVVHHQSEEYNLSVALRQATIGKLFTWIFYLPLAFMGVPWQLFVTAYGINLIYQFVLHTRAVGMLPRVIEWIMNTPSHHRVHHGVNPKYQDRNYAGVFIVFDKWFGTFEAEDANEPVVYGVTMPLRTWNPIRANLQVFTYLFRDWPRVTRWSDRLRLIFGPPGWRPPELGGPIAIPPVSADTFVKYDPPVPGVLAGYGLVQFVVATMGAIALLRTARTLPIGQAAAAALLIVVAMVSVAGVFERAKWTRPLETARLLTLVAIGGALLVQRPDATMWGAGVVLFSLVSLVLVWRYRHTFTEVSLSPVM